MKRLLTTITLIIILITLSSNMVYAETERSYNWYFSQKNTGKYSNINCGSAVSCMALKWVKETFKNTVEDVRNMYKTKSDYWTTNDVLNFLFDNHVEASIKTFPMDEKELAEILQNNIMILCVDSGLLYSVKASKEGHFIIVKGYKKTSENKYLIAYDPYLGKDKKYLYEKVLNATKERWNYTIIVEPSKKEN